jgi:hypothetical membrane protein
MIAMAATAGALTPIAFTSGVLLAASQFGGYSHVNQKISELGGPEATAAWIQNLNFVVLGLLILSLAWALGSFPGLPRIGAVLLGYFGVIAVVHAFLSCDVGCAGSTTTGLLHNVTGLTGFVSTIAAMFVFERRWREDPDWRGHAGFTRVIRLVAIAGLVWFVVTQAADAQATAGIAQRVFAGALVVWVGATGWRLRRIVDTSKPSAHESSEAARTPLSA